MTHRWTCQPIIDAIDAISEIEWGRFANDFDLSDSKSRPPSIIWRFKSPDDALTNRIKNSVENFKGEINWGMEKLGRNWIIAPKEFIEFVETNNQFTIAQISDYFAEKHPNFALIAYNDVPKLAEKLYLEVN
jgi:hypothetical protein